MDRRVRITSYTDRHFITIGIISIIFIVTGCVSKKATEQSPTFFFQMADTQFGMFTHDSGFAQESTNFTKAIASANHLKPAFVIVCGDMVNQHDNREQVAEYKRIAGQLNSSIPIYPVPGNHDVGTPKPTKEAISSYHQNFGKDYYTFKSGSVFGIVLNSSLVFDSSLVPEEAASQEKWLMATLEEAKQLKNINIIIFQHIPWFTKEVDEKNGYFNIPLEHRKKYLDLFNSYGVKFIFAGHLHKNSIGNYKEIEMVTTGPVGKPLGKDSSGFRVVTVDKNIIKHQYYSLDSIAGLTEIKF
jgi:predicted MPP superfamily phosphohydrolase